MTLKFIKGYVRGLRRVWYISENEGNFNLDPCKVNITEHYDGTTNEKSLALCSQVTAVNNLKCKIYLYSSKEIGLYFKLFTAFRCYDFPYEHAQSITVHNMY